MRSACGQREAAAEAARKRGERRALYDELATLFGMNDPRQRGLKLESLLNRIFEFDGIGVRELHSRHRHRKDWRADRWPD